uniref:Uncharacterized protein n=1 Tax=Arundo donax TaxID=35708 RepID=A0A0A8Y0T5_ARUDO
MVGRFICYHLSGPRLNL